jgi:hypothetical protein
MSQTEILNPVLLTAILTQSFAFSWIAIIRSELGSKMRQSFLVTVFQKDRLKTFRLLHHATLSLLVFENAISRFTHRC